MLLNLIKKRTHNDGLRFNLLRVYGSGIERQKYPGLSIFKRYAPGGISVMQKAESKELEEIALHHRIRDEAHLDESVRNNAAKIRRFEKEFRTYKASGEEPTVQEVEQYMALIRESERLEIIAADVILCTCIQAGNPRLRQSQECKAVVRACIVDEAGQCTEPETVVATIAAKSKIVLIGDHRQLQPVVQNSRVTDVLSKSMFERLSKKAMMLTEQYRMV